MSVSLRKPAVGFDIDTFVGHSSSLDTEDIDFDSFRSRPLDEASLRCLRYMHDVEFHTICYLRDVLVTRAHRDPEITTFLTFWAYEEYFHGDAIARILALHDEINGRERVDPTRAGLGRNDRFNPMINMVASWFLKDFIAIHMTWGAINEWTTQAGYSQLIVRAQHPTLTELLKRIMKQEGRHIDFYATQAAARLADSKLAQRATRAILRFKWEPVGSGVMPKSEVDFLVGHLFGGEDGKAAAERIDRRIRRLPGLDGLALVDDARRSRVALSV